MEKHKCADCGLLAARNSQTRELEEVQEDYRNTGKAPKWSVEVPRRTPEFFAAWVGKEGLGTPVCFMRVYDLSVEFKPNEMGAAEEKCLQILGKERECSSFIEWKQGFTPKEHREMMDREGMLKWQAEREDKDRDWRAEQERIRNKQEWRRYIFLAVCTLLAAAAGSGITYLLTHGDGK